ncbi:hypothetical protein [Aquibacillus sediminis]|uniref:hypothetical protein n=1 Tax=Aquibacillus sediminis TaxID=2574734 RepID=UPI0011089EAC|nr:hypothetical protein [Aquibacillus sediminis]
MKIKLTITVVLVIIIAVAWNYYPKPYTKNLNGVYYQLGNEEVREQIKMRIDGRLRNPLFGKTRFDGTVEFEGEEVPRVPEDRGELELWFEDGYGSVVSFGRTRADGVLEPSIYYYGTVYSDNDFSQFTIAVYSRDTEDEDRGSWSAADGLMITAPAEDREQALKINQQLFNQYEKNGNSFIYDPSE